MTHPAVLPPSDKPSASQLAGCYGKAAYGSKGAALDSVARMGRKHKASRAYRCDHCHAWHLATPRSGL